ncbi:Os07g0416700, partial [Oryza sativa Japonica Group]
PTCENLFSCSEQEPPRRAGSSAAVQRFHRSVIKSFSYLLRDVAIAAGLLNFALVGIPVLPAGVLRPPRRLAVLLGRAGLLPVRGVDHRARVRAPRAPRRHPRSGPALVASGTILLVEIQPPAAPLQHQLTGARRGVRPQVQVRSAVELPVRVQVQQRPVARLLLLGMQLTVGWPMYLVFNTWGRWYPRFASHFDPSGAIYMRRERVFIAISDIGMLAVSLAL